MFTSKSQFTSQRDTTSPRCLHSTWHEQAGRVLPPISVDSPLRLKPSHFLMETRATERSHAVRYAVTGILGPSQVVAVACRFNLCSERFHVGVHFGIYLCVEILPMVPDTFLKMRELGNLPDPSGSAIAGHVLIDEMIKRIVWLIPLEGTATVPQRAENQLCIRSSTLVHETTA